MAGADYVVDAHTLQYMKQHALVFAWQRTPAEGGASAVQGAREPAESGRDSGEVCAIDNGSWDCNFIGDGTLAQSSLGIPACRKASGLSAELISARRYKLARDGIANTWSHSNDAKTFYHIGP